MANRFLKTSGLYFAGSAGSRIIMALLLPIYAFFVEPGALGTFDFVQTGAAIAAPVCFLAVWEAIIRFCMPSQAGANGPLLVRKVVYFSIIVGLGILALSGTVVLVLGSFAYIAGAIAALAVVQGWAFVWQYSARAMERRPLFAASGIASAAVNLALVLVLVVALRMEFLGLWIAFLASQAFVVVLIEARLRLTRGMLKSGLDLKSLRPLLRFSAPLVVNLVAMLVLSGFGRILITLELTPADNGLYVFAMKIATLVAAVGTVFTMTSIEETVFRIGSGAMSSFFSAMTAGLWQLLVGLATLTVAGLILVKPLLEATNYADSYGLVPLMLIFAVISAMSTNYGNAFQATLRMKYIAYTTLAGVAVCIPTSVALMRLFDVTGVAIGLCAGAAVTLIIRAVGAHRMISFRESPRVLWVVAAFATVSITALADGRVPALLSFSIAVTAAAGGALSVLGAIRLIRRIPDELDD